MLFGRDGGTTLPVVLCEYKHTMLSKVGIIY